MMRLPHMRRQLKEDLSANLAEICEAYDLAVFATQQFSGGGDRRLAEEYATLCCELEEEVVRYMEGWSTPPSVFSTARLNVRR